jgi:hypothetical protein
LFKSHTSFTSRILSNEKFFYNFHWENYSI